MFSALLFQHLYKFANFKDKGLGGGGVHACNNSLTRHPDPHFMALEVAPSSQGHGNPSDQCRAELPPGVPISSPPWVLFPETEARMSQGSGMGG